MDYDLRGVPVKIHSRDENSMDRFDLLAAGRDRR